MKTVTFLNGQWKFAPTHDQKWTNNHNVAEITIPAYADPRLDRRDWETVQVPGVWQKYAEKYSVYEGVCWFYREFILNDVQDASLVNLVCKGINYRADVYINGQYAGWHESAYTEFSLDISKLVKVGKNTIAVQVDNRPLVVKWPNDWGYGVYGGIHRDIFIEVYRESYITHLALTPDYDVHTGDGVLYVSGEVTGSASDVIVQVGEDVRKISCKDGRFSERLLYEGVTPWSPVSPNLYACSVSLAEEMYHVGKIGFRNVCCSGGKFLLNGKPAQFNGACYVYDSPRYGLVMEREQLLEDLQKMKEAHVNAIRTHYPMSDGFYELCDEMGFMVWIEPNIYCSKPLDEDVNTVFKQPDFVNAAVSMTREMVTAAKRFASVVIYGIGNECNTEHSEALPFFETVAGTIRSIDETRAIGYASLYGQMGSIGHLVDIMGFNSYFGWYDIFSHYDIHDKPKQENGIIQVREPDLSALHEMLETAMQSLPEDMPLLLTEFGADSVPGYYSAACELWSEDYHAKVVASYVEAAKEHKTVAGTFVFAFTDYADPSKPMNGRWNGYNLKGMLTYDRHERLAYYALKQAYEKA